MVSDCGQPMQMNRTFGRPPMMMDKPTNGKPSLVSVSDDLIGEIGQLGRRVGTLYDLLYGPRPVDPKETGSNPSSINDVLFYALSEIKQIRFDLDEIIQGISPGKLG